MHDGSAVLLEEPDQIISEPLVGMTSAFWRYMVPIYPAPSLHELAVGLYTPIGMD